MDNQIHGVINQGNSLNGQVTFNNLQPAESYRAELIATVDGAPTILNTTTITTPALPNGLGEL